MKIVTASLLVTLDLVCSAYAAPVDSNDNVATQIASAYALRLAADKIFESEATVQDNNYDYADAQMVIENLLGGEVTAQDDDYYEENDDDDAQIEALFQDIAERASSQEVKERRERKNPRERKERMEKRGKVS